MSGIAILIYICTTQNLGGWWWLFGPALAIDLIQVGWKAAKE